MVEINRYVEKKFAQRVTWRWIKDVLGETGAVSKMALILKQKDDRSIILDMRRSQGNSVQRPTRELSVVQMLQEMWKPRGGDKGPRETNEDDDFEIYLVDLEDAFGHFPVRKEELTTLRYPWRTRSGCAGVVVYHAVWLQGYTINHGTFVFGVGKVAAKHLKPPAHPVYRSMLMTSWWLHWETNVKGRQSSRRCCIQLQHLEWGSTWKRRTWTPRHLDRLLHRSPGGAGGRTRSHRARHLPQHDRRGAGDLEGMGGRWNGHGERPAIDDRKVVMDWRNTSTVTLDSERYVRHAEGRWEGAGWRHRRATSGQREDQRKKIGVFPIKRLGGSTSGCSNSSRSPSRTSSGSRGWKSLESRWASSQMPVQKDGARSWSKSKTHHRGCVFLRGSSGGDDLRKRGTTPQVGPSRWWKRWQLYEQWKSGGTKCERAVLIRSDSSVASSMTKRQSSPPSIAQLPGGRAHPAEGVRLMRGVVWKANNLWLKAPGDTSEGGQTFIPPDNIFDHLARR